MKERTVSANKGTNKEPKGYSIRILLTNSRIAKGGDPHGNGVTIVVRARESLVHGEGE